MASAGVARFQLFLDFDELDKVFYSEVGEGHDAVIADAVDPDDAVLCVHFIGDVIEDVHAFIEALATRPMVVT
jgi:hypothetical protein